MKSATAEVEPYIQSFEVTLPPAPASVSIFHNMHMRAACVCLTESVAGFPFTTSEIQTTQPNFNVATLTNLTAATLSVRAEIWWQTFTVGQLNQFRVDATGDMVRINDVPYQWPSAQGSAGFVLTNSDGAGTLSWSPGGGGGGMAIGAPVAGGTSGNVLYVGPGPVLAQVPNAAGVLVNDGAGNLSWGPNGSSGAYTCPSGIAVRDAVYLSSSGACDKADADDATKQPLIGVVVSKPTAFTAVVQYHGEVGGYAGLIPGATYYLSTVPGQITSTPPSASGDIVQRIGFAKTASVLVLMVDRDYVRLT